MNFPRRQSTDNYSGSDRTARKVDVVTMPVQTPPPVSEQQPQVPVERIGDILRRVRVKRGDDLGHIAEYLCIRRTYLVAIEDSDYEKFPADTYVIGFLRSYAELMGLDGKEAINLYRAEMAGRRKKPSLNMPTPMQEGRSPSAFILIGALVTAILVYAIWYGVSTSDRITVSVPTPLPSVSALPASAPVADATNAAPSVPTVPVVPVATSTPTPVVPPAAPVAEAAPPKPAVAETPPVAKSPHLVIRAEQSSWIMVADSKGETIFDRVMKPGETYKVPDAAGLTLTTGNADGLLLTLDGVNLPKFSSGAAASPAGIMRNIPLDAAHLKAVTQAR